MEYRFKRIVVKIGSNVLTCADGTLDTDRMEALTDQIAALYKVGVEVILVSSGAVASGRGELGVSNAVRKLDTVSARQLFSTVGQVKLINRYYELFRGHGIVCGQILTTKQNFSTRKYYLNQRNCMTVMLASGVIPIVNENDAVSVTELMFTDNDELSGLISTMMDADALVILSNVDGIYNGNPVDEGTEVICEIDPGHGNTISKHIQTSKSEFGRGGMHTKFRIACKVAAEGIEVFVANGKKDSILTDIIKKEPSGVFTRFIASDKTISGVKKWIAHSEDFAKGELHVNERLYRVLTSSKAVSLLPVGIECIEGEFEKDDIVKIFSPSGEQIGVGRISCDSARARALMGKRGGRALVHYDYLYLD